MYVYTYVYMIYTYIHTYIHISRQEGVWAWRVTSVGQETWMSTAITCAFRLKLLVYAVLRLVHQALNY
jgi:hypothetical protein